MSKICFGDICSEMSGSLPVQSISVLGEGVPHPNLAAMIQASNVNTDFSRIESAGAGVPNRPSSKGVRL